MGWDVGHGGERRPGACPTYPVCVANVVAAGVEPEVGVAVPCAVFLAVVEDALEDVGDGAVVAAAVAGGEHDNVPVPRRARIAVHAARMLGDGPVPLRLALEVGRLRGVVACGQGGHGLARRVVAVVLDGHVAVELEEHDEDGDGGDGQEDASARVVESAGRRALATGPVEGTYLRGSI